MATVNVQLTTANTESRWAGAMPVANSIPQATGQVTSSGANQAITLTGTVIGTFTGRTSPRAVSDIWCVTSSGGNVNVSFGAAATTTSQWRVQDGQTRWFGVTNDGESINVIDAP